MATPADERAKHSIIYQKNTSDIKDDIVQLIGCLKSNQGALGRQTAAFLLWYHALEGGEEVVAEMAGNNVINICLTIMDSVDASTVDKSCAAGILTAICECEAEEEVEYCEQVIKGRSLTGTNALVVLHNLLDQGGEPAMAYSARVLRLVAQDPMGKAALMKLTDQKLGYCDMYRGILSRCHDHTRVEHVCAYIGALLHERDDLKGEAIAGGLVEALFDSVRYHKAEQTICMAMRCIEELASDRESWPRIISSNGIPILVDVLGPPPAAILKHEMVNWKHVIDIAAKLKHDNNNASSDGKMESPRASGSPKSAVAARRTTQESRESAITKPMLGGMPTVTPAPDLLDKLSIDAKTEPDPRALLSINSCGLKWHGTVTMATFSAAAGCLYEMCHRDDLMHAISRRCAASRLVPLLSLCMESGEGGKRKGKKKGLTLTPEQTEALTRITGCLKFLTMVSTNCYRAAHLGAVKPLKPIYEECGHMLLRRNAQVVLSNVAMLAENGQAMLDSKIPEEFLVTVPMRLTQEEKQQLLIEFPEATFDRGAEPKALAAVTPQEPPVADTVQSSSELKPSPEPPPKPADVEPESAEAS